MTPRLLLLAADLMGVAPGRGCNDYTLPADLSDAEVRLLCDLANEHNLGAIPRERWREDDIETPDRMRRNATDFVVMYALAEGLRLMAKAGLAARPLGDLGTIAGEDDGP